MYITLIIRLERVQYLRTIGLFLYRHIETVNFSLV